MDLWIVPLLTAGLLAIVLLIAQLAQRGESFDRSKTYRKSYLSLVAKVDSITSRLTGLEMIVPAINEPKLLDYYESCLRMLENLLTMFKNLEPFGSDVNVLRSAHFLTKDCLDRVDRTEQAFKRASKGRSVKIESVYGMPESRVPTGCYFCSRPFIYVGFERVKVRLEGEVKKVYSCDTCKETLKQEKKVKVLNFMKDGKPVHWSEVSTYNPIHDYWNINKKTVLMQQPKLELIHTKSGIKKLDDDDDSTIT